jgi:DNA glycosylase AlkZ-like
MTWAAVVARRMERQALAQPAADVDPAGVASLLCGVHAQLLMAAELAIGRRIAGATRSDVQRALWEERSLIKTFGPRGTVHLLATTDLPMWTGALSALPMSIGQHPEPVRFTSDQVDEVIGAVGDALEDDELTVDELTEAIRERTGEWAVERTMDAFQVKWPRWRQLTSTAAHRGVLCFGRNKGRNVTYTNPHRWLAGFRPADESEAVHLLVRRYLHAFGPASPEHFARWLGISPRAAREAFETLGDALEVVEVDGERAWVAAGDTAVPSRPADGVRMLPYFDAYVVAGQPRARLFPGPAATRALTPSGQAGNYPVLLVDGVVGGVWHQRRSGRRVVITVEPLGDLTTGQRRGLEAEAALVAWILEGEPELTIGTVRAGAHA